MDHLACISELSFGQVVENSVKAVKHLKSLGCNDIEFSPEDASRSDPVFLYRVLSEVIKVRILWQVFQLHV